MRVLQVYSSYFPKMGGVEVHLHDLCECLKRRGHHIVVLTYAEEGSRYESVNGVDVQRVKIPKILLLSRYPSVILLCFMIWFLIRGKRIDLIHVHGYVAALAGAIVKPILKKPVVATFHLSPRYTNRPIPILEKVERRIGNTLTSVLDAVINISEHNLVEMKRSGIKNQNHVLIRNWVPLSTVSLEENGAEGQLRNSVSSTDFVNIISVGRLSFQKGFDILVKAASILMRKGKSFHVKIIGDGGERNHLLHMCANLGLEENIELIGRVTDKEKVSIIKASDIFVLSSRFEGLPLTVLEAMYLKKPVIATDVNGMNEIITNGISGLLVEPNEKSLAEALELLISNLHLRQEMAKNARETVEKRFSSRNCIYTVSILEKLIRRN